MKLKSVTIDSYKNLKGTYSFENNSGYIALIGLNGSGKSNLLEIVSIIFDKLINKGGAGIPFDYQIEYELNGHTYTRKKGEAVKDGIKCPADQIEYPTSLIACYSGEDLRLWRLAYENYHMGFFNKAVKESFPIPKFLYVNKYCWTIALLSLICSNDKDIKTFLSSVLRINHPSNVEVSFTIDAGKRTDFGTHDALAWFDGVIADGLTSINVNTIATKDVLVSARTVSDDDKSKYIFYFLYLLSQPKKNEKNKIEKLITDIKIRLNTENGSVDFEDLSEGEKKLILIECITKVLGDENALILLDEPDAHTHVAMKKDLLKLIAAFPGQTIMTTHSPMFLNKRWDVYKDTNVFYINNGKIETTEPLKHLAELTGGEIDYFEGSFLLSSKKILVVEGKYDDKYLLKAIDIFAKRDARYAKLKEVTIISANGASAAEVIYNQVFANCLDRIEKLVFLFDYDDGGWKDGWKKIDAIPGRGTKVIPMFYQDSYPSPNYPTSDADVSAVNRGERAIKIENSFMVEDIFPVGAYSSAISDVVSARTHKEFRKLAQKKKKPTSVSIKEYIEGHYQTFADADYDGFKTILDELLKVFI